MAQIRTVATSTQSLGLAEVLERVLDKGLVIAGDIKIKLCDIELLTIQIRLLIASVDKAKEMGLTWWWQTPEGLPQPQAAPVLPQAAPQMESAAPRSRRRARRAQSAERDVVVPSHR